MRGTLRQLFIAWLILGWSGAGAAVTAVPVRLGYANQPFEPYQRGYGEQQEVPPGLAVDLIVDTARELGIRLKIDRMPLRRLVQETRYGGLQGAFSFSYSPERLGYLAYPMTHDGEIDGNKALFAVDYYFFTRPGFDTHLLALGPQALAHYRVGVLKDSAAAQYLDALHIHYDAARTAELNLEKLRRGRLDMVLGPEEPTLRQIRELGWSREIRRSSRPLFHWNYFLVFKREFYQQNWPLCEAWWRQIQQRRDSVIQERMPLYR